MPPDWEKSRQRAAEVKAGAERRTHGMEESDLGIVCAGQRPDQVGSSPAGAQVRGAISESGGNTSLAGVLISETLDGHEAGIRAVRRAAAAGDGRPAGAGATQALAGPAGAEAVQHRAGRVGAGLLGDPCGALVGAAGEPPGSRGARPAGGVALEGGGAAGTGGGRDGGEPAPGARAGGDGSACGCDRCDGSPSRIPDPLPGEPPSPRSALAPRPPSSGPRSTCCYGTHRSCRPRSCTRTSGSWS